MSNFDFQNPDVAAVFAAYPEPLQSKLLALRELIFEVAASVPEIGPLHETLKWGQPSYLTNKSKSGTTVRIDKDGGATDKYALYVNCQTSLIEDWREHYPQLTFSGNRGVHFSVQQPLPVDAIRHCISMALTYHLRKKARA